jgi:DNA-directed RNA polymerase specialized sigma24 family protein
MRAGFITATMTNNFFIPNGMHEGPAIFRARFSHSYQLLDVIACRVLGSAERADDAIANCWLRASRNPPRFESEGAFRSWLVRVLIDEALAILREAQVIARGGLGLRNSSFGVRNQSPAKRVVPLKAATEEEY